MNFMEDYWLHHSCYEIPRNYAFWSAFALLGSVVHRKVLYLHGDIEFHANLYVGLIGPQGSSKSTCCSFARAFFIEACSDLPVGPSRASPESLCKAMTDDKFVKSFTNWNGEPTEVRPYAFFINEFKNFVGRSPFDMVTFLTDIYDVKAYDASTIIRGAEFITNPAVNVLMCETPDWFIRNIKGDIISGGIARRFVLVYELDETEAKPFILLTPEVIEAKKRIKQRLIDMRRLTGEFKWGTGKNAYEKWYRDNHARRQKEASATMRGYLKSKNVQLYKAMMLLDVVSDKPMFSFSVDLVDTALAFLASPERNMPKLSLSAGRNEMVASYYKAIETLERNGGMMQEKALKRELELDLTPTEIYNTIRYLEETEMLHKKLMAFLNTEGKLIERWVIITPKRLQEGIKTGEFKIQ